MRKFLFYFFTGIIGMVLGLLIGEAILNHAFGANSSTDIKAGSYIDIYQMDDGGYASDPRARDNVICYILYENSETMKPISMSCVPKIFTTAQNRWPDVP